MPVEMDLEDFFQRQINAVITRTLAVPGLPARLGVVGAGERWDGPRAGDQPGWFFWLDGRDGVYELAFAGALGDRTAGDGAPVAQFPLRYFPGPDEAVLGRYGFEERALIAGGLLGRSRAPSPADRERIDTSLFTIGLVELAVATDRSAAVLNLMCLDRLRLVYPSGLTRHYAELACDQAFPPGTVDRDVPSRDLAVPLFAALSAMLIAGLGVAPSRIAVSRAPGFSFRCDADGEAAACDDPGRQIDRATVAIGRVDDPWFERLAAADGQATRLVDWHTRDPWPVFPGALDSHAVSRAGHLGACHPLGAVEQVLCGCCG